MVKVYMGREDHLMGLGSSSASMLATIEIPMLPPRFRMRLKIPAAVLIAVGIVILPGDHNQGVSRIERRKPHEKSCCDGGEDR
jgi:hypothetical protein